MDNCLKNIVLCGVLIAFSTVLAQTEISGEVSGEWSTEGSPYVIIEHTVINADDDLTVLPGVIIEFEPNGYIELNGTLSLNGTERDSIIFTGDSHRGYIRNSLDQFSNAQFIASYIRMNFYNHFQGSYNYFDVTNSSFSFIDIAVFGQTIVTDNLISHDVFYGVEHGVTFSGNQTNSIIDNNIIENMDVGILYFSGSSFSNNTGQEIAAIFIGNSSHNLEITGNDGINCLFDVNRLTIYENRLNNLLLSSPAGGTVVSNNTILGNIRLRSVRDTEIYDNQIGGGISIEDCDDVHIHHNVAYSQYYTYPSTGRGDVLFSYNTFLDHSIQEKRGDHPGFPYLNRFTLRNNIFAASHVGGIALTYGYNGDSDYNCFWGFDSIFGDGSEIGEHDIIVNPKFNGGNPFDVSLQFDSELIDSGDPDILDPDRTASDIGARYFNQRMDHDPVITSNWWDFASTGNFYSYTAEADDDRRSVTISLDTAPHWMRNIDEGYGFIVVGGRVPDNQSEFTFVIKAEDRRGNEDTLSVGVNCLDGKILRGSVSGTFTEANSPYYVVDDIILSEGNTLTMEPGVHFEFKSKSPFEYRQLNQFDIFGKLLLLGDEDNQIQLTGDQTLYESGAETRYRFNINSADSIIFRFVDIGISLIDQIYCGYFEMVNSGNTRLDIISESNILLKENQLLYVRTSGDTTEILNNNFNPRMFSSGVTVSGNHSNISENIFSQSRLGLVVQTNTTMINHNLMYYHENAITLTRQCSLAIIQNNTIANCRDTGIGVPNSLEGIIRDNIIDNSHIAFTSDRRNPNIQFVNNLIGYSEYVETRNPPTNVGIIERVNHKGDSTDVFGNMFLEAKLLQLSPKRLSPVSSSPAVNAGREELAQDPDGSRIDIGYYFFDHDDSPPLINWHVPDNFEDTTNVYIRENEWQRFTVNASDEDSDTLYYGWQLDELSFGNGIILREQYEDSVTDSIQFNQTGWHYFNFHLTDGNELVTVTWFIQVGNIDAVPHEEIIPNEFTIFPAYPNPFNSNSIIKYNLPVNSDVNISMIDSNGRIVFKNVLNDRQPGTHHYLLSGNDLSSGTYFVQFSIPNQFKIQKINYIK